MHGCPLCGGPGILLGKLGHLTHLTCRDCGMQYSTDEAIEPVEYDDDFDEYDDDEE